MEQSDPAVDFIIPVYNEGSNFEVAARALSASTPLTKRLLVVHDFDEDDTLPVARRMQQELPGITLVRNRLGRGVLNAIRSGIDAAKAEVVIVTMADLSDDVSIVGEMVRLIREGHADVVCASRYMRGGQQIGGPAFKKFLSRTAGLTLRWLGALPVHDATNAFRAYRLEVLRNTPIESVAGFEYTLELTVKARAAGYRIAEVPTTWRDRSAGQSRFRLMRWLPHYLKWYLYALTHRPQKR